METYPHYKRKGRSKTRPLLFTEEIGNKEPNVRGANGSLDKSAVRYSGGASVCVVAASKGYPDAYEKGKEIKGLDSANDPEIIVYHAGTKEKGGKIFTNGGRVLGITSIISENNLKDAKQKSYEFLPKIFFDGIYYRKDISDKALKN